MKRSSLAALLISTVIGVSFVSYSGMAIAEEKISAASEAPKAKEKAPKNAAKTEVPAAKAAQGDYVLVKFAGGEIRKSEFDALWRMMGPEIPEYASFPDDVKAEILKNMLREHLVLQKAYAANIDKSDEVKDQLEFLKRQVVIKSYLRSQLPTLVPEKDIRKEYNLIVEKNKGHEEVHARHILFAPESEAEAKAAYEELKKGGDFVAMAKEKSLDKGSGANGGDLGYFTKESMVPEFAEAAFKMKKGEISAPVKTEFGWHIIKVEDRRAVPAPKLEEVKDKIKESLAGPAAERYVNNLLEKAAPKYFASEGVELKAAPPAEKGAPEAGAIPAEILKAVEDAKKAAPAK